MGVSIAAVAIESVVLIFKEEANSYGPKGLSTVGKGVQLILFIGYHIRRLVKIFII